MLKSSREGRGEKVFSLLFCLYLVLPAVSTLPFLQLGGIAALSSNGFVLSICLVLVFIFVTRGKFYSTKKDFSSSYGPFILFAITDTLIMALFLGPSLGTLYGETAISAVIPSICWLVLMGAMIPICIYGFRRVPANYIDKTYEIFCVIVLFAGICQICYLFDVPGFSHIASLLSVWAGDPSLGRISTLGSEPSACGVILCLIVGPFCISKLLFTRNKRFGVYILIMFVELYFSKASTSYIAGAFLILGVVYIFCKIGKGSRLAISISFLVLAMLCFAFLLTSIHSIDFTDSEILGTLSDNLFGKVLDASSNMSTAYRLSTVTNDLLVFSNFPVLGCGDGLQGFFYNQNMLSSLLKSNSYEIQKALNGGWGLISSGNFSPAIVSSFGIVGTFLFLYSFVLNHKVAKQRKAEMGSYYYMYLLSVFSLIPLSVTGIGFHTAYVVYPILAMPFISSCLTGGKGASSE